MIGRSLWGLILISNEDYFKSLTMFFITIIFFIVILFFSGFLQISSNELIKTFSNLLVLFSLISIIIFPLHFIIYPIYKEYYAENQETKPLIRLVIFWMTALIEGLMALWLLWFILIILYYPVLNNAFGTF